MNTYQNKKLEVANICKSFESKEVLKDINIVLNDGEIISLLGTSGAGKTTLFNIIAGLIKPNSGKIVIDGNDVTNKTGQVSYMLQKDLLLPYKTVLENIALPLIIKGVKKQKAFEEVMKHLETFGLLGFEDYYPTAMSGGMCQRAALLRTYMFSDNVALLDEPFSALDTITKSNLQEWYLDIMKQIKLSTIFITHDIDEAIYLSNRVYILGGGNGGILDEIVIDTELVKSKDFLLSADFIAYKKRIMEIIAV